MATLARLIPHRSRTRPGAGAARWTVALVALVASLVAATGVSAAVGSVGPDAPAPTAARPAAGFDLHGVVRQVESRRAVSSAGPAIGDGQPINPSAGAPMRQELPDVAFDGTNYLVVWTTAIPSRNGATTIAATRVTPAGEVLDEGGILVPGEDARYIGDASVAFDGDSYLVAFEDGANVISGLRIGTDGVVRGQPFAISDGVSAIPGSMSHTETNPAVAVTGSTALVVWEEQDVVGDPTTGTFVTDFNIVGTRIDGTDVLDPTGRFISQSTGQQRQPDVASNGSQFFVVWADDRSGPAENIYGARVQPDGTVLDTAGIAIGTDAGEKSLPVVTGGDSLYLVAWTVSSDRLQVRGARVSTEGTVLDTTSRNLAASARIPSSPAVAYDGRQFIVVWWDHDGSSIGGTYVSRQGQLTPAGGIRVSPQAMVASTPAVAAGAGVPFVTWGGTGDSSDVWGARLAADGTVLDLEPRLISIGNDPVGTPAAVSNGTESLVVWRRSSGVESQLSATRITADGTVLDPNGILIGNPSGGSGPPQGFATPVVATDGTSFLIAFNGTRELGTCPVSVAVVPATTGDATTFPIASDSCTTPAVAFDGTNYIVTTAELDGDLLATVVSPTGSVVDSFPLTEGETGGQHPVAAGVQGTVLVAWERGATRVDSAGTIDPVELPATIPQGATAVGSDGTDIFLMTRMSSGGTVSTRIASDGEVLDPAGIPVSGTGDRPSVAFNRSWLIVWNDRRTTGSGPGVYGARIQPSGVVVDPDGFVVAPDANGDPAVSARLDGRGWTVAYPGYDPGSRSYRQSIRQVAPK